MHFGIVYYTNSLDQTLSIQSKIRKIAVHCTGLMLGLAGGYMMHKNEVLLFVQDSL